MSMRITVSYEKQEELKTVLTLLNPVIKVWNKAYKKTGQYNRVYIKTQQGNEYSKTNLYKTSIINLLNELTEADTRFLCQVYTILKNHKDRAEG